VIFLVAIDWVMRKDTEDKPRGLPWGLNAKLEDCNFADDVALLSQADMQEKTARIEQIAKTVRLKINSTKSKLMKLKTKSTKPINKKNGVEIEEVDAFKYLGSYIPSDGNMEKEIASRMLGQHTISKISKVEDINTTHPNQKKDLQIKFAFSSFTCCRNLENQQEIRKQAKRF
jgi:hypothetical protein